MNQIAFTIGSKPIHWYGVCIALGFLIATGLMLWKRDYAKMTKDQIIDVAMLSIFTGILGARIFYVVQFWDKNFAGHPFWKVFRIDEGGLVFYGGFICAFTTMCVYGKLKKISPLLILDMTGLGVVCGHAFGRIGCFMQGCCFGKVAAKGFPGAVVYPAGSAPAGRYPDLLNNMNSLPLYPVQIYEFVLNILLCAGLILFMNKNDKPGRVSALYIAIYAVIRFILEFFRGDHKDSFLGMTPSQNVALFLMLPLGILLFFFFTHFCKKNGNVSKE
ncbi:MAG: prolipoprotein diacylglyceryl transferase [Lentisphaeria bacterium]|nr:prolipoprotein diacylglyceryl transferase [Lentisphaeria bacterium]